MEFKEDEIYILSDPPHSSATQNLQYLSSVDIRKDLQNKDQYYLVSQNTKTQLTGQESIRGKIEEAYLIVRSFLNEDGSCQGYELQAGDTIKLGRMEYQISEIRNKDQVISYGIANPFVSPSKYNFNKQELLQETSGKICRICLDEHISQEQFRHPYSNLLISPCNCKGSCKYLHYACLKNWIESKIQVQHLKDNSISVVMEKLQCEVCKHPLPSSIFIDGNQIELIAIKRPKQPYILFQKIVKEKNTVNGIFLLRLDNGQTLRMGRGHSCQLRVSDISVSRLHAYIKNMNGSLTIFDNTSKFGTLVLMSKEYRLSKQKVAIQIGFLLLLLLIIQDELYYPQLLKLNSYQNHNFLLFNCFIQFILYIQFIRARKTKRQPNFKKKTIKKIQLSPQFLEQQAQSIDEEEDDEENEIDFEDNENDFDDDDF